jgi:hypothetical protein
MFGGNRNINISKPDTEDNPRLKLELPKTNYVAIGIMIAIFAFIYIVLWVFSMLASLFFCWSQSLYQCGSAGVVHWIFISGLVIFALLAVFYILQKIVNVRYLYQRGVYLDRAEVTRTTGGLVGVMKASAKSEATYGLDTYSPSVQHVTKTGKQHTDIINGSVSEAITDNLGVVEHKGSALDSVTHN